MGALQERALAAWGRDRQLIALAEECNEAAAAALRILNGKGTFDDLRTELVDIDSLTESLEPFLGAKDSALWQVEVECKEQKLAAKLGSLERCGAAHGCTDDAVGETGCLAAAGSDHECWCEVCR